MNEGASKSAPLDMTKDESETKYSNQKGMYHNYLGVRQGQKEKQ